jgi:hypothetical protein
LSWGGFTDNDSVVQPIDNSHLNNMYYQELEQGLIKAMQVIHSDNVEINLLYTQIDQLSEIVSLQKHSIGLLNNELKEVIDVIKEDL